jgi:hypothetical protein
MLKTLTFSGSLILVASAGFAQQSMQAQRVPARLQDAGVYHVATGTWSRGGQDTLTPSSIYYQNSANTGFFGIMGIAADIIWTDEGCVPGSGHIGTALDGSVLVQGLDFAYCTTVLGTTQNGGFLFYDSYISCTDPIGLPTVAALGFSAPGAGASGTNCWLVGFDLTGSGAEFKLTDDADGVFDGSTGLDNFGWTLILNDQGAGGFNGPFLNGDPNNFPAGDGTYYQNPAAVYATGLDTADQFWLSDPSGSYANGCYWFGGYVGGNPYGSFWLTIHGKPNGGGPGTKYCIANPNSAGAPADISSSGSASSAAGTLQLNSAPVPNQPSIFFHANNPTQVAFGDGFLCASGGLVRGGVTTAVGNIATWTYDNSDAKHSVAAHVGTTRRFQHWFRDPMAGGTGFNTSNAIAIAILP